MFTILGAVLNMGNITFEEAEDEGAVVQDAHSALRITAVSCTNIVPVIVLTLHQYSHQYCTVIAPTMH